jgi:response regulator of citrate/malate metabolism
MSFDIHSAGFRQNRRTAERLIIMELMLQLNDMMSAALRPRTSAQLDTAYVAQIVYRAHLNNTPITAHKITTQLRMPRATVQDRLHWLEKHGYIRREGKYFLIGERHVKTPTLDVRQMANHIIEAARKLLDIRG